ncbi:putative ankyrin repeat protein RF_0381 isoform X2 [Ptychodera flava]
MADKTDSQVKTGQFLRSDTEGKPKTATDMLSFVEKDISEAECEEMIKVFKGDVNEPGGEKNKTILHHAVERNRKAQVKVLVKHGADTTLQDSTGSTVLHHATKNNNSEMLRFLLDSGADLNIDDKMGFPPLHIAVQKGYVECMRALLEHGGDPNRRYEMFNTAFHEIHCVPYGSLESLELLLKFGADPKARDANGLTALHSACQSRAYPFVEKLIDHGADVNAETPPKAGNRGKYSVLRYAVNAGDADICKLLLERGADPNVRDLQNVAPLHVAAQQKHVVEIVQCLLDHKADVTAKNNIGQQPLHLACTSGADVRILRLLLQHGADPNTVTKAGEVPMHGLMWKYRHTSVDEVDTNDAELKDKILTLLKHGAHFNLRHDRSDPFSLVKNLRTLEKLPKSLQLVLEAADSVDIHCDTETTPPVTDDSLKRKLSEMSNIPQPLKHQSRKCIRSLLGHQIHDKIETLPLPQYLNDYIFFQ